MSLNRALLFVLCLGSCQAERKDQWFNNVADGKRQGKQLVFDSHDNIISILNYRNDTLNGESIWYHSNGNIRSKVNYLDGKENGMAYYFYPTGVIESFREWKNGKKNGYAMDYYDTTGETKAGLLYNTDGLLIEKKMFNRQGEQIVEK